MSPEQDRLEAIGDQLRGKIASKFAASTFLAGFALTVLTGQTFALWQSPSLPCTFPGAVALAFGGFVLFVEGVVRLDELTMPKRFWDGYRKDPTDPPSLLGIVTDRELLALFDAMVFYWTHLTMVAAAATGIAVFLMLIPCIIGTPPRLSQQWSYIGAVAGALVALVYRQYLRRIAREKFTVLVPLVD